MDSMQPDRIVFVVLTLHRRVTIGSAALVHHYFEGRVKFLDGSP